MTNILTTQILGFNIEYIDEGNKDKPVLVFAHGLGGSLKQWQHQIERFKTNHRVIAFSLQGHGNSSKSNKENDYTIRRYGKVVIELMEFLQVKSCTWVGNSMGGVVGYEVMKEEGSLVDHIITNGTTPKLTYSKSVLKMIEGMDRILIKVLGFKNYLKIAVNATLKDKVKKRELLKLFMESTPHTIIASHQILGNYDYLDTLKNTNCKVSFILTPGDKDINKSISKYKENLLTKNHITFHEVSEGGHVFNVEMPDEYCEVLLRILENSK